MCTSMASTIESHLTLQRSEPGLQLLYGAGQYGSSLVLANTNIECIPQGPFFDIYGITFSVEKYVNFEKLFIMTR